jgi:dGTPase
MVTDILKESAGRIKQLKPKHPEDIRGAGAPIIAFSETMADEIGDLKTFLNENMYRHFRVNRMSAKGKRVVTELFNLYIEEPGLMPPEWSDQTRDVGKKKLARVVADFIAGMTDRYALREYKKLFDITALEI